MKYKNTNKLMIVAHADDELIWAGETLLKEKGQWDILCVVTPDHQSKFRIPMFLENVSNYLECNTTMLDFIDSGWYINRQTNKEQAAPINGDINTPILEKIKSKEWSVILTHGESGEYGHYHHTQVHQSVKKALSEIKKLEKLFVFAPIKHSSPLTLSKEKLSLFENTYDIEGGLPPAHPRQWVHGWNTNMGWEEKIINYETKKVL